MGKIVILCGRLQLQRARWVISEEEYITKWDGDKNELVEIKAKGYNEFKSEAIEVIEGRETLGAKGSNVQVILVKYPRINGEHSYLDDIKATNPNYTESRAKGDKKYTTNCQRCVNAYEARRREYDVTAAPKLVEGDPLSNMYHEKGWANVYENGRESLIHGYTGTTNSVRHKVTQEILSWGEGGRGIVQVRWQRSSGGHVFIGECHDGEVIYLDPQVANMDASWYFDKAKTDKISVLRIDDKEFSELIDQCCTYSE